MAVKKATGIGKGGVIAIASVVVIGLALGLYFILKKPKEEENSEDSGDKGSEDLGSGSEDLGSGSTGGTKSSGGGYTAPPELNTTDKIKAFQDWMDKQGKGWIEKDGKWVLLKGGSGYGSYGKYTDSAWKVYGKKYLEDNKATASLTGYAKYIINSDKVTNEADKKNAKYLNSADAKFLIAWVNAIKSNKRAFVWSNQVWRTKTGERIATYNPIGVRYEMKITTKAFKKPDSGSSGKTYNKDTYLGKAVDIDYNSGLWIKITNNTKDYPWHKINDIKVSKSSFEGIEYEPTSSFTSQNLDLNL